MTDPDATPESPPRRRPWPAIGALAATAIVGGLIGGLVVRWTGGGSGGTLSTSNDPAACVSTAVAQEVLPSVVTVLASHAGGGGNGSGQIIRAGGYILTNDHVVSPATAEGGQLAVRYSDGSSAVATLVGRDPLTDLAVIKAEDGSEGRPLIAVGSSSSLRVGQPVVALGAPIGLYSTVTAGIVSALDRYVPVPAGNGVTHHLLDAVQTDASINPGNSGGALVDCAGRLVGVNSAIATVPNEQGHGGGGSVGIGFAIPSDLAIPLADQLIAAGRVDHPTFGVQAIPIPQYAGGGGQRGLVVTDVDPGGPADQAGIRPGDFISEVDRQPASSVAVLERAAITRKPGDTVDVTYVRDGTPTQTKVTLAGQG